MAEGKKIKINRRPAGEAAPEPVKDIHEKVQEVVEEVKSSSMTNVDDIQIPDIETATKQYEQNAQNKQQPTSVVKEQQVEKRKLFANKKLNIALIVFSVLVVVAFVAMYLLA